MIKFKVFDFEPDCERLLWALHFMKTHKNEANVSASIGGFDEKTVRTWDWRYVKSIGSLVNRLVSTQL